MGGGARHSFSDHTYSPHLWLTQDDAPIPEQDKTVLRSQLVPTMIALSDPADKTIRAQIAESVALIAELDFPVKWSDLIDVSYHRLTTRSLFNTQTATRLIALPH
jgi:hypothetical protein